jgi:hypothetical protein
MTRPLRWAAAALALAAAAVCVAAYDAGAVPRYSVRYEQNCMLCHVNPTGGGMRSAYATDELVPQELAMSPKEPAALAVLDTYLNKHIRIGADFRNQFMLFSEGSPEANQQGFFPMQGDLLLSFQLDPKGVLYYKRGISNATEYFYVGHVLPWGGYVKGGRFVPPYGWKFDDHTMYVREYEGFAPPTHSDAGIEMGLAPRFGDLTVAVVNGNRGGTLDNDRRLAVAARASTRFHLGPALAVAGLSGYTQPGIDTDVNRAGAFGALSLGPVTWLGQADLTRDDPASGPAESRLVTSHELSVLLRQGVEVLGTYDFLDPDRDFETGALTRFGVGAKAMPRSFMAIEMLYRHTDVQQGARFAGPDYDEGVFQLHLLY